jgi:hypothetical protein
MTDDVFSNTFPNYTFNATRACLYVFSTDRTPASKDELQ